jgi:hypothetical protein
VVVRFKFSSLDTEEGPEGFLRPFRIPELRVWLLIANSGLTHVTCYRDSHPL